jgi:WD40 repeat protein
MQCIHTVQFKYPISFDSGMAMAVIESLQILEGSDCLFVHCYYHHECPSDVAKFVSLLTGEIIYSFRIFATHNCGCISAASNDGRVLVGNYQDCLHLYNIKTGERIASAGSSHMPTSFVIAPDNQTLIVGAHAIQGQVIPNEIEIFNLSNVGEAPNFERTQVLSGHKYTVKSLLASPDGTLLLSQCERGSRGQCIDFHRLWSLQTWELICNFDTSPLWIADALFMSQDKLLACGTREESISVWDLIDDRVLDLFPGISPSHATSDGRFLAYCNADNEIIIWNLVLNKKVCTLVGHSEKIQQLMFSNDRKWLVSSTENTIKVWSGHLE